MLKFENNVLQTRFHICGEHATNSVVLLFPPNESFNICVNTLSRYDINDFFYSKKYININGNMCKDNNIYKYINIPQIMHV